MYASSRLARRTSRSATRPPFSSKSARTKAVASATSSRCRAPSMLHTTSDSPSTRRLSPATVSSATIRPPARTSTRSASFSASSRSCVVRRIVVPSASASRCTRSWNSLLACGSKPAVGSSRNSSSGRPDDPDGNIQPTPLSSRQRRDLPVRQFGEADRLEEQVDVVRTGAFGSGVRRKVAAQLGEQAAWESSGDGLARTGGPPRCGRASPRLRGPGPVPRTDTSPADRIRKPSRISMVVVLPAPFGPSRQSTSPLSISKSTPESTSLSPYRIRRSRTVTTVVMAAFREGIWVWCTQERTIYAVLPQSREEMRWASSTAAAAPSAAASP